MMIGVATFAGVGFTVALFISHDGHTRGSDRLFLIAGTFGAAILRSGSRDNGSDRVIPLRRGA
jgi:hypothetical protein